ncbi:MAG: hypothetical protein AAGC63_05760 [Propionicimonas sp.]|nr:hypothetical protein [Propionicimonas sp.]
MTLADVLGAIGRRWYIVLVGLLCTGLALYSIQHRDTVFYSRASVYFLAPASELYPNVLRTTSLDLVAAAGVVAKRINGTHTLPKTSGSEATLVGRGVRDGAQIKLIDNGGQWSTYYNVQALDVEVVAPTIEEVQQRQAAIFARINQELDTMQTDAKVPEEDWITTEVLPSSPAIYPMRGQGSRALGMTLALGVGLTLLAIGTVELAAKRRRLAAAEAAAAARRHRAGPPPGDDHATEPEAVLSTPAPHHP